MACKNCKKPCTEPCEGCASLAWRRISLGVQDALHAEQSRWIRTPYSGHQREVGCGASCYSLVAGIMDTLYGREAPTPLPLLNTNVGMCDDSGAALVLAFRRQYPLIEVRGTVEPGDLIVTRSVPGISGPAWAGHVMMAGKKPGQVIHALPATGVEWGSLVSSMGRVLKVYRPQRKDSWER